MKQSNRPLRNNLKKEKEQNDKILALSVIKKHPRRVISATTKCPTLGKSLKSAFLVTNIFKEKQFGLAHAGTQCWVKHLIQCLETKKCKICNFVSFNVDRVRKHKKKHTGEKPLRCKQCKFGNVFRNHLKKHQGPNDSKKQN